MTELKKAIIIGAGQMGQVTAELLNVNKIRLLAFGDNDPAKWRTAKPDNADVRQAQDAEILSVQKAVGLGPDIVIISTVGTARTEELAKQVKSYGYNGAVMCLKDFHELFDIRSRCIRHLMERIQEKEIPGAVAELGVYRGDTAWQLNLLAPERILYLFDTFAGFDERDFPDHDKSGTAADVKSGTKGRVMDFKDTSVDLVLKRMPFPENVVVREGYFPATTEGMEEIKYAFVSLDPDLYAPVLAGIEYFYPRLSDGGVIVVHDYDNRQFEGVRKAVDDYEKKNCTLKIVPLGDIHGSCVIVK